MAKLLIRRNVGQSFHIGTDIVVTVTKVEGGRVTIDVIAPPEIVVLRDELFYRRKPAASTEESHT